MSFNNLELLCMAQSSYQNYLSELETTLNQYFGKNAPEIPLNAKEVIVKIAPYLVILSLIFSIPALLALLGLGSIGTVLTPMGGMQPYSPFGTIWINILFLIAIVILQIMAVPGLFARTQTGWRYMDLARLFSVFSNLALFYFVRAIINALIGFYLLFQVKSLYK